MTPPNSPAETPADDRQAVETVFRIEQARLIAVAPALASASVALNTSVLYLGQAAGSAIGGELITRTLHPLMGPTGAAFMLMALAASWWANRRFAA